NGSSCTIVRISSTALGKYITAPGGRSVASSGGARKPSRALTHASRSTAGTASSSSPNVIANSSLRRRLQHLHRRALVELDDPRRARAHEREDADPAVVLQRGAHHLFAVLERDLGPHARVEPDVAVAVAAHLHVVARGLREA